MFTPSLNELPTIYQHPVELLQRLIGFDTTNPPGNEAECIGFINAILQGAGFETLILSLDHARPNLITRLKGRGDAPPLLMYGHIDVATTENEVWQVPPFEGRIVDGVLWGRGSLDMKSGIVMMLSVIMDAKARGFRPPGDIIFAVVSDHEAVSEYGTRFLISQYRNIFEGVRYAIGEFGGFTTFFGGKKFYPIQVSEAQIAWVRALVTGTGVRGSGIRKLANLLDKLGERRLPVHVTPVVRRMIETMAASLPEPGRTLLSNLLDPKMTDSILDHFGIGADDFDSFLHNKVNTIVVKPKGIMAVQQNQIDLELSVHILPGFGVDEALAEVKEVTGDDFEFEVLRFQPVPPEPDMGLFDLLEEILLESDPSGVPVPFMAPGVSDGRFFSQIGVQTYGFLPMDLPAEIDYSSLLHAANERITVEAMEFGINALQKVIERFGGY